MNLGLDLDRGRRVIRQEFEPRVPAREAFARMSSGGSRTQDWYRRNLNPAVTGFTEYGGPLPRTDYERAKDELDKAKAKVDEMYQMTLDTRPETIQKEDLYDVPLYRQSRLKMRRQATLASPTYNEILGQYLSEASKQKSYADSQHAAQVRAVYDESVKDLDIRDEETPQFKP